MMWSFAEDSLSFGGVATHLHYLRRDHISRYKALIRGEDSGIFSTKTRKPQNFFWSRLFLPNLSPVSLHRGNEI